MRGKRDMLVDLRIRDRNGAGNEACNEVEWRLFRDCHIGRIMAFRTYSPCSCFFFVSIGLQFNLQTLTYSFLSRTTHRSTSRRSAPPLIPRASLGLPRNQLPHQPAPLAYPRRPLIRWRSSRQRRRRGGEVNPFRHASSLTQKRAPAQQ